jgi:hypothetical protein
VARVLEALEDERERCRSVPALARGGHGRPASLADRPVPGPALPPVARR